MAKFLQDDKGNLSSMRLTMLGVAITVLGVFTISNIALITAGFIRAIRCSTETIEIQTIDFKPYMVWALGLVLGGKVGQSISEKMKNKNLTDGGVK